MGGSPKPAVDNIKEILNIKEKRKDYLGELLPLPHLCCPAGGTSLEVGVRGWVPASWLPFY